MKTWLKLNYELLLGNQYMIIIFLIYLRPFFIIHIIPFMIFKNKEINKLFFTFQELLLILDKLHFYFFLFDQSYY